MRVALFVEYLAFLLASVACARLGRRLDPWHEGLQNHRVRKSQDTLKSTVRVSTRGTLTPVEVFRTLCQALSPIASFFPSDASGFGPRASPTSSVGARLVRERERTNYLDEYRYSDSNSRKMMPNLRDLLGTLPDPDMLASERSTTTEIDDAWDYANWTRCTNFTKLLLVSRQFDIYLKEVEKWGNTNHYVLSSQADLASALLEAGNLEDAETLQSMILEAERYHFGSADPNTVRAMNVLGETKLKRGDLKGAVSLQLEAFATLTGTLGSFHEHTLQSKNELVQSLQKCNGVEGAQEMIEEVLATITSESHEERFYSGKYTNQWNSRIQESPQVDVDKIYNGVITMWDEEEKIGTISGKEIKDLTGENGIPVSGENALDTLQVGRYAQFRLRPGEDLEALEVRLLPDTEDLAGMVFRGRLSKWWDFLGYGFIRSEQCTEIFNKDIFLWKDELNGHDAEIGDSVEFSVVMTENGRPAARNVKFQRGLFFVTSLPSIRAGEPPQSDMPVVWGRQIQWTLSAGQLKRAMSSSDGNSGPFITNELEVEGMPFVLKFYPDGSPLQTLDGHCSLYLVALEPAAVRFQLFAGKHRSPEMQCSYDRKRDQGRHDLCRFEDALSEVDGSVTIGAQILEIRPLVDS